MSMIPGGKELVEIAHEMRWKNDMKEKLQTALDKIKLKDNLSRCIMNEENNDLSLESTLESGKLTGRLDTIQIFMNSLGFKIEDFDY